MKNNNHIYQTGELVKVDRMSSENGTPFLKIVDIKETEKGNHFYFDELDFPVSEYYIRPVSPVEFKYKALFDKKYKDFDINQNEIKRTFWNSQKENLKLTTDFLINFLYPYLKDNNHILNLNNLSHDDYYNIGFTTKNNYWVVIPHNELKIIIQNSVTSVFLFIILPNNKFVVYYYSVEYSDDYYTNHLNEMTKHFIKEFEKQIKENKDEKDTYFHYYFLPFIDFELRNKLEFFSLAIDNLNNDPNRELPHGQLYTLTLFNLSVLKNYFFFFNL